MVTITSMDDAAEPPAAATATSNDTLTAEPIIQEPESTNMAEKAKATSDAAAPAASPPESAPPETTEESVEGKKRSMSLVLKVAAQEEKKKKEEGKRHRKALSSVLFIPAASDDVDGDRIRLGICAMDKKARSKPMAEILSRLDEKLFKVVFFGDHVILHEPVEEWPICDVLIAFHSKGYPLDKAEDYVELRKPFILNDLEMQETMKDRRRIYDLLEASGIDVPRHVFLSRDGYVSTGTGGGNGANEQEVTEFDDHIEVNGVVIHKPVRIVLFFHEAADNVGGFSLLSLLRSLLKSLSMRMTTILQSTIPRRQVVDVRSSFEKSQTDRASFMRM